MPKKNDEETVNCSVCGGNMKASEGDVCGACRAEGH